MDPKVAVYVPAWNAEQTLGTCLESLLSQTVPFDEVIVVDDGSTDRTAEVAAMYGVTVVANGINRGLSYTRNVGLSHARNELIASVDSDCVIESNWLETLLPSMEDKRVACAGGSMVESHSTSASDLWRSRHLPQSWGTNRIVNPRFLFGCDLLSKKSAVLAAGGYNIALRTNGEDADLSSRLTQMGFFLIYEPSAHAHHLQQDTVRTVMDRWRRWHHAGVTEGSLLAAAKNSPQNLVHGLEYAVQDLPKSPRLVPLDLAFPLVQAFLDAHPTHGHMDHEVRKAP